jgi:hypothetical protein
MRSIVLTDFCRNNNFNPNFGGTKILGMSPEEFECRLTQEAPLRESEGYAPFCKHVFWENFTDALDGVAEISMDNEHLLKSGYEARRPEELPVLTRWFDRRDIRVARAKFLDVIVYSREHLENVEGISLPAGAEWGIVTILSSPHLEEAPMAPATMVRNSLGPSEGGSGVPLDRIKYQEAVLYWSKRAVIK